MVREGAGVLAATALRNGTKTDKPWKYMPSVRGLAPALGLAGLPSVIANQSMDSYDRHVTVVSRHIFCWRNKHFESYVRASHFG